MADTKPLVSILIPAFNMERYIRQCVWSALNQSYTNTEIIICDNASTDGTVRIVSEFSDNRLQIVRNDKNIGAIGNFNKLLSLAKGEFIKFLEADDYLDSECIGKLLAPLLNDPEAVMSCCGKFLINSDGQITGAHSKPRAETVSGHSVIKRLRQMGNEFGTPSDVLFVHEAVERAGVFDPAFGNYLNDWDLWIRIARLGRVAFVAENLAYVRRHPGQIGAVGAADNRDIRASVLLVQKNFEDRKEANMLLVHFSAEFLRRAFGRFIKRPGRATGQYVLDTLRMLIKEIGVGLTLASVLYFPTFLQYFRLRHRLIHRE
jgi:glycosyltransferase involved in cell wall biosynthesis